ncbi:hypothetical protein [Blastococcus sp. Marseille-P5729]|uniref:hypothetical protein n=1 Tax=Blastococcus sp. Marseille-P5729 TaxID=2086582 RepID=UPI000D112634|nr:hypothetical protein [Blastococcus sp. Marseille-P5729]
MQLTGDGIFDIQLADRVMLAERRPPRRKGTMLRSRAQHLGLDVPDVETSFEPLTQRDARRLLTAAIYDAQPVPAR